MTTTFKSIIALLMFVMGTATTVAEDFGNLQRYAAENAADIKRPLAERRVVLFGNSITENWRKMRPEFFTGNGFLGRGISGQSTYQFVVRFREDVVNLQPEIVVINAATNDVAENTQPYNEDYTFGNIATLCELAKAAGIKVVLTTTLPAARFGWNPSITDAPAKIKALNDRLAAYAAANGIPFVDYYSALADESGALPASFSADGVHPNDDGYAVMESLLLPVLTR